MLNLITLRKKNTMKTNTVIPLINHCTTLSGLGGKLYALLLIYEKRLGLKAI